jgi:hypothetical protein
MCTAKSAFLLCYFIYSAVATTIWAHLLIFITVSFICSATLTFSSSRSLTMFHYLLVCLRSSSSCLHLIPRLSVPSIFLLIIPSIRCFRLWPF